MTNAVDPTIGYGHDASARHSVLHGLSKGGLPLFKRLGAVALVAGMVFAGTVVTAVAAGPGAEVDPSLGSFSGTAKATAIPCSGEDGGGPGTYLLVTQKLKGVSVDSLDTSTTPGDFSLSGKMTSTAKLTVNTATGQGWGTGVLSITNAGGSISGPVTVVIQQDSQGNVEARGMWIGTVKDPAGVKTGDLSVENFELTGNTGAGTFSGFWGPSPAASVPDLSVKTSKVRC
jgi:hypothetical protein